MQKNPKPDRMRAIRPKNCMTPAEVARKYGVTATIVRIWIVSGQLIAAKASNGYFWIRIADVEKFINNRFKDLAFTDQSRANVLQ